MSAPYENVVTTIDAVSWTPIVAPFPCSRVQIRTKDLANDLKLRTDSASAATEETIPAGVYWQIPGETSEFILRENQMRRIPLWKANDTICYVQAVAGTGPVIANFKQ